MSNVNEPLTELFRRFSAAVKARNLAAYQALRVPDPDSDDELFERNADRAAQHQLALALRDLDRQGSTARIAFDVVDRAGKVVGEGHLLAALHEGQWRIHSL